MWQIGFSQNGNSNILACSSRTPSGVRVSLLCPRTWQVFVTACINGMCWKSCHIALEARSEKLFSLGSLHLSGYMPLEHSHHVVRKSWALEEANNNFRQDQHLAMQGNEPSCDFPAPSLPVFQQKRP